MEHKLNSCICVCFWWQILGPRFHSQKYADISWVDLGGTEALCVWGSFTNPDWFIMGKQIRNVNVLIRSEVKYKTSFSMQISVNSRNLVICNKINIVLTFVVIFGRIQVALVRKKLIRSRDAVYQDYVILLCWSIFDIYWLILWALLISTIQLYLQLFHLICMPV